MPIKNVVENAKYIAGLVKKYQDAELHEAIITLREQVQDLREENLLMREQLQSREDANVIAGQLRRDGNVYYWLNPETQKSEGPFCLACWDYDRKLVSVIVSATYEGQTIRCAICSAR